MNPYEVLAGWYDELMGEVPYEQWADRILSTLDSMGHQPKRILELACGTGRITEHLLDAGHWVTGVDQSEAMLQEAQTKLGKHSGKLRLIASNMLDFTTTEKFDAILSVCDGFNYLPTLSDLENMLRKCTLLCRPGGLILFDLSTDWKFRNHLKDTVIAENHEEMAFIWENQYEESQRVLTFDLTFFIKQGSFFRRETEHHIQRAHSPQEIEEICRKLDMTLEGIYDGYSNDPVRKDSERFHCIIRNGGTK